MNLWQLMLTDEELDVLVDTLTVVEEEVKDGTWYGETGQEVDRATLLGVLSKVGSQAQRKREVTGGS